MGFFGDTGEVEDLLWASLILPKSAQEISGKETGPDDVK